MAIHRQALLNEYRGRLAELRSELTRCAGDGDEATRLRDLIEHYEQQIRDLEQPGDKPRQNEIGAGPTLGGDGKAIIDC